MIRKFVKWLVIGFFALLLLGAIIGPSDHKHVNNHKSSAVPSDIDEAIKIQQQQQDRATSLDYGDEGSDMEEVDPEPTAAPEPKFTMAQENAIESAQEYLQSQSFSQSGLMAQLQYEDFSHKDALFAVNHIHVNWKRQAVKSAQDYLDSQSFSQSGLVEQLEYEGFTSAQAEYAVNKVYS